jgi:hypothetical protein
MSDSLHADLSVALATRLNLQISLSALPVVEEWMDPKLDRWLESVPMPPEMPRGGRVSFLVAVATDLSRLRWGAYGHPAGFIPKLADYLSKCGVSPTEVGLINAVGERFEPEQVGSWISVTPGTVRTGWHFLDDLPLGELATIAGDDATRVAAWCRGRGIERCVRFSRCIGDDPYLDVVVPLPGDSAAELSSSVRSAFSDLVSQSIAPDVLRVLTSSVDGTLWLAVRSAPGAISRLTLLCGDLGLDVVASLCGQLGIGFDSNLERLQGSLGADKIEFVEYALTDGIPSLDLHFVPGMGEKNRRPRPN